MLQQNMQALHPKPWIFLGFIDLLHRLYRVF